MFEMRRETSQPQCQEDDAAGHAGPVSGRATMRVLTPTNGKDETMSDNTFEPTRDQFISVALVVHRATFLLSRADAYKPTGRDAAEEMKVAALVAVERLEELLVNLVGSHRDAYARDMGWPSADALLRFLFDGMAPPG